MKQINVLSGITVFLFLVASVQAQGDASFEANASLAKFDFMIGSWDVNARVLVSQDAYLTGTGRVDISTMHEGLSMFSVVKITWESGSVLHGSTFRTYNPEKGTWTVVWLQPGNQPNSDPLLIEGKVEEDVLVEYNQGVDGAGQPYTHG